MCVAMYMCVCVCFNQLAASPALLVSMCACRQLLWTLERFAHFKFASPHTRPNTICLALLFVFAFVFAFALALVFVFVINCRVSLSL